MKRDRAEPNSGQSGDKKAIAAICVGLIALTWIVFCQTLHYEFIDYDDNTYVYENPKIIAGLTPDGISWAFTHVHSGNWHPLTTISHMLDCWCYGLRAGGHHFTNVLLHTLVVVLFFLVLREMTGTFWRSAFVAAIFAIHPLRVESVAWIAERKDVLSGLFFVLTLAAYVRYARKTSSVGRYLAVLLLFGLGLLSKPMLVTTPFVLLFLDYWPLRRFAQPSAIGRIFLEKIPLLALSAASSVATLLAHKQSIASVGELGLSWRLSNAVVSCLTYLWQMVWPVRLAPFYPHLGNQLPLWEITLAASLIISITGAAFLLRKRQPYFFTGWFWYLVMLVPVLGVIQVGMQAHADRYTYLPQVGLYILVTWMISDAISWRPLGRQFLVIGAAFVITGLAWRAWIQTSYWHDSETLWTHTLKITQDNDVAHTGLGDILFARGKVEEAISEFRTTLYLRPNSAPAHRNLGVALSKSGALDEAIEQLNAALRIKPDYPAAQLILGNAFLQRGQLEAALAQYEKALALQPDDVGARCNLATVLLRKGDLDQAIAQYRKTIETRPDHAEAHYNLGNCYAQKGEIELALNQYEEALKLSPENPEAHNNLGVVLSQKGNVKDAIAHWQEALRIQPDKIDAQNNLAWILATSSNKSVRDGTKALNLIKRAQQLSGIGDPKILRTLAAAYAETGRFQEATETARQGLELANAQGNTSLANTLETDLARYRTNLPLGAP